MQHEITLDLMTYIMVLIAFGSVGSCYQAYKEKGSTRPFAARLICGFFAGSVTLLVVYLLKMQSVQPGVHLGMATILGVLAEMGEGARIVDLILSRRG